MSIKEVIAVDVDEVLLPTMLYLVDWHNANHSSNLTAKDYFSYDFWHVWGGTREEAIEKCLDFHEKMDLMKMEPIEGALEVLERLKARFELVVVTARHHEIEAATIQWLDRNFPGIFSDHLFGNHFNVSTPGASKAEMCQKINARYLIDDSLKHVTECAKEGVDCLLFGNYAWNISEKLPANITRVRNWNAVEKYFSYSLSKV